MRISALTIIAYLRKKKNNIINSTMSIQEEMYKAIETEIDKTVEAGKVKVIVNNDKTELSASKADAYSLVNQYNANIKNICK